MRFKIQNEWEVAVAREQAMRLVLALGGDRAKATLFATALSEIAQNMVTHAGGGELRLEELHLEGAIGLELHAIDLGPGIAEPERALEDGYSSIGSLGLGLPGARRMVDEFELGANQPRGTHVRLRKWFTTKGEAR